MIPAFANPNAICNTPQITTATRNASNDGSVITAAATNEVRPAAGPETLRCDLLAKPTMIPPTTPAINPLKSGAFDANATPKQRGRATRNTTMDAGISLPIDDKYCFVFFINKMVPVE